jgi:hypothetical protein
VRIVVIGCSGHCGSSWFPAGPRGDEVVNLSRGARIPYSDDCRPMWRYGPSVNVAAPSALTARGLLKIAAGWFGQSAEARSMSWAESRSGTTAEFADSSWQHLSRSQYASIE